MNAQERSRNRTKSRVISRVVHVFRVLKCRFGFTKVPYRGLEKNANNLFAALALVNSGDGAAAIIANQTGKKEHLEVVKRVKLDSN